MNLVKKYGRRLLAAALLLQACHPAPAPTRPDPNQSITEHVTYSSFPSEENLAFQKTGEAGFFTSLVAVDSFLLCPDLRAPRIIKVINTNTGRTAGEIVRRGNGKGECLSVANILLTDQKNIFWVYDITLGKLQKIDLLRALRDTAYQPEEEFSLDGAAKRAKSPVWINDSTFAACSYLLKDARYFYFNKRSEIVAKAGELPPAQSDWPLTAPQTHFSLLASIYTANMSRRPESGRLVLAYNKTDRVDIYEHDKLKRVIRGPDQFEPVVSFNEENGEMLANENSKTRFAYVTLFTTPERIYTMYSGDDHFNTYSQRILVYDKDGNPQKIFRLNGSYNCLTIGESNGKPVVYAMEKTTGSLCRAPLG